MVIQDKNEVSVNEEFNDSKDVIEEIKETKRKRLFSKKKQTLKRSDSNLFIDILSLIRDVFACFVVAYVIANFIINPIRVDGSSMHPTIEHGDVGFSNILSYKLFDVKRFDIVVVFEDSLDEYVIKRVIGLPGETIQYKDNELYVNGKVVDEDFLDETYCNEMSMLMNDNFTDDFGPTTLSENEYFIVGDNRPKSSDSRTFGAIDKSQIKSKDTFVLYPFSNFGMK